MKTSKRLQLLAKIAPKEFPIADVGSDHGYLLYILRKNGFEKDLFAIENKIGPFEHLNENIKLLKLNNVSTSFSNGLEKLPNEFKTVVIAGMGLPSIEKIINNDIDKLKYIEYFVIDSHTNFEEIRFFFDKIGYYVYIEDAFYEKNIFYELIVFAKGKRNYTDLELKFGPILLKQRNKDFLDYYRNIYQTKTMLINKTSINEINKEKLKDELHNLEEFL